MKTEIDDTKAAIAFNFCKDNTSYISWTPELSDQVIAAVLEDGKDPYSPGSYSKAYAELEQIEAKKSARLAKEAEEEARRGQERVSYLRPALEDRKELVESMRKNAVTPVTTKFVPSKEYTKAEIDAMSGDQYAVLVLGGKEKQVNTSGVVVRPERAGKRKTSTSLRGLKRRGMYRD